LGKGHILGERLHDVRAALRVQGFAFLSQETRKGLTVSAITYDAIRAMSFAYPTLDGSALTLQGMLHVSLY
jgi:hypothetical protein